MEYYLAFLRKFLKNFYPVTIVCIFSRRNPAICDNMDEPGGHYAKWNMADIEGQILHDTAYVRNLNYSNS